MELKDMTKHRASYLLVSEQRLLNDWGKTLRKLFNNETPYLVGSALDTRDVRDIDIRVILCDQDYAKLPPLFDVEYLNLSISLWGQKVTGLPIDFQIQQMTRTNETHKRKRIAIGIN